MPLHLTSGYFKGPEVFFSLCVEGTGSIGVPYHCSSYLPKLFQVCATKLYMCLP